MKACSHLKLWWFITVLILILAVGSYVYVDQSLTQWVAAHPIYLLQIMGHWVTFAFGFAKWAVISFIVLAIIWWRSKNIEIFLDKEVSQFFVSLLLTMFIVGVVKVTFARYRPEMLMQYHLFGFHFFALHDETNSMPSDHSALIFTMVTFFALHRNFWRVVLPLFLIGGFLVFMRVIALRHYLSDVFVGGYIGYSSALLVHYLCETLKRKNYVR